MSFRINERRGGIKILSEIPDATFNNIMGKIFKSAELITLLNTGLIK